MLRDNNLRAVKVTTLPAAGAGTLTMNGTNVVAGQFIAASDISAGNFRYTSALNQSGAPATTFTFQVQDDGGTANGGVDLESDAKAR